MFIFRKIWRALFSGNLHLEIRPFRLITDDFTPVFFFIPLENIKNGSGFQIFAGVIKREHWHEIGQQLKL